jgi:hypothetical protein
MKTIVRSFFAVALLVSIVPSAALAQAPQTEPASVALASLSIQNCAVQEEGGVLAIACDFVNKGELQPDIRYSLQVVAGEGSAQYGADEKVFDDIIALAPGQTVRKEFSYTLPSYVTGRYSLSLRASNSEGLALAATPLGSGTRTASAEGAVFKTCYLTVAGETDDTQYTLRQGVDIANTEDLVLHCMVSNVGTQSLTLTPNVEMHRRNVFGEKVDVVATKAIIPLQIAAGETKEYSFTLPKASLPQAYDAVVSLLSNGVRVSNLARAHYVLQGGSATVQTIALDKKEYKAGETALVKTIWTGSADSFPESRSGGSQTEVVRIHASLMSHGNMCGSVTKNIDEVPQGAVTELQVPITEKCTDPEVTVQVLDAKGTVIAAKTVTIPSDLGEKPFYTSILFWVVTGILLILIAIAGYILWRKRKEGALKTHHPHDPHDVHHHSGKKHKGITFPILLLPLLAGAALFFAGVHITQAQADDFDFTDIFTPQPTVTYHSFSNGSYSGTFYLNSLNDTYSPGETIQVGGDMSLMVCSNTGNGWNITITNTPNGQQYHEDRWGGQLNIGSCDSLGMFCTVTTNYFSPSSFTAPTAPGTYTMHIVSRLKSNGSTVVGDITYTVVSDNEAPTLAIEGPTTGVAGVDYEYKFTATDPDGDQVQYAIDWDNNGSVDQGNPDGTPYNSGQPLNAWYRWNTPGTYTFKAYAADSKGANSSWIPYTIVISAAAGGSCSVSPDSASTGQSVTWTASPSGGNGSYTYAWSGTDGLSGTNSSVTTSYGSTGVKTASVAITSLGQTTQVTCSNSVSIGVAPQPDLAVDTPANISGTAGQPLTLSGVFKNIGNAGTGSPFPAMIRVAASPSGASEGPVRTFEGGTALGIPNGFPAGFSETQSGSWTPTTAGTYYYRVCIDVNGSWAGSIAESNEDNNCSGYGTITVAPGAAAFAGSCSVSPATIAAGESATWSATATGGAGSYTYAWSGTDGLSGTGSSITKAYGTQGTKSGQVVITSGTETITVVCSNAVTVGSASAADLTAGLVSPTTASPGVPVTLSATASNIGGDTSGSFPVLFQVQDPADLKSSSYVSALAPGSASNALITYTFPSVGTYEVRACANNNTSWENIVTESNYGNNCGGWTTITVGDGAGPNTACTVSPSTLPSTGGTVTYNAHATGGASGPYRWTPSDGSSYNTSGQTTTRTFTSAQDGQQFGMSVSASQTGTMSTCPVVAVGGGGACSGPSAGTITANPNRVQPGDTSLLTANVSNIGSAASCIVTGPGVSRTITPTPGSCTVGTTITTPPIVTQSTYRLNCGGVDVDSVTINVIPKFEEF